MDCAINAALNQKLFSLRPDDNRCPDAKNRTGGALFDFTMPNGLPARGYVDDAGHAEVNIHVAVNPKDDWVRTGNGGFHRRRRIRKELDRTPARRLASISDVGFSTAVGHS